LSREIVKHLNMIEEKTLESLAWTADSPLWILLKQSNSATAPGFAEVSSGSSSISFMNSPAPKSELYSSVEFVSNKCSAKRQLTFNGGSDDAMPQGLSFD